MTQRTCFIKHKLRFFSWNSQWSWGTPPSWEKPLGLGGPGNPPKAGSTAADWLIQETDGWTPCLWSGEKAVTLWCDSYSREGVSKPQSLGQIWPTDCVCKQSSIGTKQGFFILLPVATNVLQWQSWGAERWWNLLTLALEPYSQPQTPLDTHVLAWFCFLSTFTGCTQISSSGSASWQGRETHVLICVFTFLLFSLSLHLLWGECPRPMRWHCSAISSLPIGFWISDALLKGKVLIISALLHFSFYSFSDRVPREWLPRMIFVTLVSRITIYYYFICVYNMFQTTRSLHGIFHMMHAIAHVQRPLGI